MKTKGGLFLIPVVSALLLCVSAATADDLEDKLIAQEKAAWQAWEDNDVDAYRDRLTEDAAWAVAGEGIKMGRDAVMADISSHDCEIENLEFADFKVRQLSSEVALLTYTANSETTCGGQKLPSSVYATSVYVLQDGKWRTASYQETAL
jgi:uncharacterized protein (TIGR02246 family)